MFSACNVGDEGGFAPNIQNNEEGKILISVYLYFGTVIRASGSRELKLKSPCYRSKPGQSHLLSIVQVHSGIRISLEVILLEAVALTQVGQGTSTTPLSGPYVL